MQNQHSMVICSFLFIVMLLAACSTMPDGTSKAPAEEIITSTYFPQSTQTSTPDPMPTVLPTLELDYDCSTSSKAPNVDLYYEDGKLSRMGNGRAYGIDWSADGSMIAIGGETGIYLIDAITMQKIRYIQTYYGTEVVRFSPHGKWIAADDANVVSIWDIDSGEKLFSVGEDVDFHSVRWSYPSNVELGNFTFTPDSKSIVLYSMNYAGMESSPTIEVWDITTQTKTLEISADDEDRWLLPNPAISPFGQWIASPWDKTIHIWNIKTGELIKEYDNYRSYAEFSPDGNYLLAHRENQFHLINLKSNAVTILNMKETKYNHEATFSSDGKRIIVEYADHDGTPVTVWSLSGNYLHDIPVDDYLLSMAVNPKKNELATYGYHQTISVWDIDTGKLLREYKLSDYIGYNHFITPDGTKMIIEKDEKFHLFDTKTAEYLCTFEGNIDSNYSASFHPEKPYFAIIDAETNIAHIWNIHSGELENTITLDETETDPSILGYEKFHSPYLEEDVVIWKWLNENGAISAWISNSCETLCTLPTHCPGTISLDGKLFATLIDRKITIFDVKSRQRLATLEDAGVANHYLFTPDGDYLLILRFLDWSVEVWDTKTYQLIKTISFGMEGEGPILNLERFNFTEDGKYLYLYLPYHTKPATKIWDTKTWEEVKEYDTISDVGDTSMSADGSLVSALSGYTLYLWHNELPLSGENP